MFGMQYRSLIDQPIKAGSLSIVERRLCQNLKSVLFLWRIACVVQDTLHAKAYSPYRCIIGALVSFASTSQSRSKRHNFSFDTAHFHAVWQVLFLVKSAIKAFWQSMTISGSSFPNPSESSWR